MAQKQTASTKPRDAGEQTRKRSDASASERNRSPAAKASGRKRSSAATASNRSRSSTAKASNRNRSSPAEASGRNRSSAARQGAKSGTDETPTSQPPTDEPDVFLDVPNVHVGRLEIDVERLEAHLALRAQAANLVNLVAGVHVGVDKVKIELEDVDASATLKVRLENVYNILARTLQTIDENPEILQGVIETAGSAVEQVGQIGSEATKPGGAVSALTSGVGDTVGSLGDTVSRTFTGVTDKLNPKGLLSGARRSGSQANSNDTSSGDGIVAKAAAGLAAGGAASLLGGALYRTQRRPRVLGIPIGRAHGLERVAKQIGKLSGQVNGGSGS